MPIQGPFEYSVLESQSFVNEGVTFTTVWKKVGYIACTCTVLVFENVDLFKNPKTIMLMHSQFYRKPSS